VAVSKKRPAVKSRLRAYRAKRRFAVTPEPAAEERTSSLSGRARFVVHKHDATRLHYDLRLEMDGVLVSWAIPKGPSFDTAERRLAVQTEDHPLAYGEFEGRIPDGEYGGGDSLLWDRGRWRTDPPGAERAMMEKGHLVFVLDGEKLHGRWHLVRTRAEGPKSQWLFFKGKDEFAAKEKDVVAERPESVVSGRRVTRGPVRKKTLEAPHPPPLDLLLRIWPPMFALTSTAEAVAKREALYEVKYDGYRALAAISGAGISLQSRNGLDLSAQFPAIVKGLRDVVAAEAVLDGEVVALDDKGNARFQLLQRSEGEQRYAVFDLLWLDGEDLRARPLEERRDLLTSLLANVDPPVVLAERLEGPLPAALEQVRRRELEGLIAKRLGSPYRSGARGPEWAKVKVQLAQEFAVVGFTPISNNRPAIGSLLLAVRDGDRYRYAGRVGTGFTDKMRSDFLRTLSPDVVDARDRPAGAPKAKDAIWVRPRLVAQVVFREWTDDGQVRQPSFQGLRADKRPEECVREKPVGAPDTRPAWRTRWTGEDWPSA
jgi:bifunctional non-homologous end joining protein LigD